MYRRSAMTIKDPRKECFCLDPGDLKKEIDISVLTSF